MTFAVVGVGAPIFSRVYPARKKFSIELVNLAASFQPGFGEESLRVRAGAETKRDSSPNWARK